MITPYLKPFNTQGGTLYVFPSVSNDLTRTFVSNDYEFKFSHFACLNIPNIYSGKFNTNDELDRGLYVETLMSDNTVTWDSRGMSKAITENLQNYVMNFETAILNGEGDNDDYDSEVLTTVSEKIFWNWLQKVGAIKFNGTDTEEEFESYADRVVQYIGNIDIMNTVEINGDSFEELYIHIPSTAGASTSVYFRTGELTDNKNYLYKNYPVANTIDGVSHPEYIIGRKPGDANPYTGEDPNNPINISIESFVDTDAGANVYKGDIGHTIDFRDTSYEGGEGINNMNGNSLEDFEFNAVLIYYDLYEKTSTPNVKRVATNLYGILFLDQVFDLAGGVVSDNTSQGFIQRYPKKRETVYGNGNSYALKLDLKIDTTVDTNSTYVEVNLDHTTSMTLYSRAMEQLQKCIDTFFTQQAEIAKLSQRIEVLENLVMGIDSVSSMKDDITRLYDICNGNGIVDTGALLSLIDANSKKLDNIMNGGKDLKLQYDTDVIQPGIGIGIQKSLNKVVINSEQRYSINTIYNGLSTDDEEITANNPINTTAESKLCKIPLKSGENFAVIHICDLGDSGSNLNINIDDSEYNWTVGQSIKIHFVCENGSLRFEDDENTGIIIKPDNTTTISIPGEFFEGNNLIEIVCVGEDANGTKSFIHLIK